MKELKELKIGEIGVIDGVRVECKEDDLRCDYCKYCAFKDSFECNCEVAYKCAAFTRSDHTDVYFKKIEE